MSTLYMPIAGIAGPAALPAATPVRLPSGLGVGLPWQDKNVTGEHAAMLHATWYYDWGYGAAVRHPLLWPAFWAPHETRCAWDMIRTWTQYGHVPLAYNEPDGWNVDPALVAATMREWAAPFSGFGTIVNDWGLRWLDRYLDAGGPKPVAWHIHVYPFSEYCPANMHHVTDRWKHLLHLFLDWNQKRGSSLPIVVSETNATTLPVDDQLAVLRECYYALERRDIIAASWFCARWLNYLDANPDWPWQTSNVWLVNERLLPTRLGEEFRRLAITWGRR